jgi:hypothetical protein
MRDFLKKKIHPLLAYPVLVAFAVCVVAAGTFFAVRHEAQAQFGILPFEGRITRINYNCLCALSILLQVQATVPQRSGQQAQTYIFFYGPQLLDVILDLLGIDIGINFPDIGGIEPPIPMIPRVYLWYMIFSTGNQRLLGNYVPGSFPCVAYSGNSCSVTEYAQGAILNVGTSLF